MEQWHIGEILIRKKLINWEQLEDALNEQKRTHEFVGEVLIRKQYIPKFLLFKALAERHAMPFVDLSHVFIDPRAVERVPRSVAVKYGFIPIEIQEDNLVVGINDPCTALPDAEIAELAGVSKIRSVLCTPDAVAVAIGQHYDGQNIGAGASA
jgi:type IV pilus assembly protein PilB